MYQSGPPSKNTQNTPSLHDFKQSRDALTSVLKTRQRGGNTQQVLPAALQQLGSSDPLCKKLALWVVASHANEADLLLAINSLTKDCQSPNPLARALALKTITQVAHVDLVEYSLQAVLRGLQDESAHVRRAAILGCAKLHHLQPEMVRDRGVIDVLYGLIRDSDPVVVLNCLRAIQEILHNEGGIVINRNINNYLLNRLADFPSYLLPELFGFLTKYQPKSEDEIFNIMNICDEYLSSSIVSVVAAVVQYFVCLTRDLDQVRNQVLERAKKPLVTSLDSANPELVFSLLGVIEMHYFKDHIPMLHDVTDRFLCKQNEPSYVKRKRLSLLHLLITNTNISDILDDTYACAKSSDEMLSKCAVTMLGEILKRNKKAAHLCVEKLLLLLDLDRETLSQNVFKSLSSANLNKITASSLRTIIHHVLKAISEDCVTVDTSLLWLIGEHGEVSEETCYVFEHYACVTFSQWQDSDLCIALAAAAVKLLLKQPAQYQHITAQLFENIHKYADIVSKQVVSHYYSLLSQDIDAAKKVMLSEGQLQKCQF